MAFPFVVSIDIDECTGDVCGSNSDCHNTIGAYTCSCLVGYNATNPEQPPGGENACIGTVWKCFLFFYLFFLNSHTVMPLSTSTRGSSLFLSFFFHPLPLQDIDECLENVCGDDGTCLNEAGSYQCQCNDGYQNMRNATPICQGIAWFFIMIMIMMIIIIVVVWLFLLYWNVQVNYKKKNHSRRGVNLVPFIWKWKKKCFQQFFCSFMTL